LCALINRHSASAINAACSKALKAGTYRFKDIRRLIGQQSEQKVFGFAEIHPLIPDRLQNSNANPHLAFVGHLLSQSRRVVSRRNIRGTGIVSNRNKRT